jgi:hypothetical protein
MGKKPANNLSLGKKGDTERYIVWFVILSILFILIIALFYGGAIQMIRNLFVKMVLK